MKRLLSMIATCCLSLTTFAQNNISLYVFAPTQSETVPESSLDYLVNSLCNAVTSEGIAAQNEYVTQFVLIPKVNVATKNVIATTQQQVVYNIDVTIQIADNLSGVVYSSKTLNLKGVGTNEVKAYNSAFRSLGKSNQAIISLANNAKQKILAYYESEASNLIKKANLLATQEKYDEAFYILSMIPSQCSKYDMAISAGMDIWKSYKDYSCSKNLSKAMAAWTANQDIDGANIAGLYLSEILQDAKCYGEALQLYKDIKAKVGDLWKFTMKSYESEQELRMAKVAAIQAIGVAYGKGQQPGLVINKSLL